MPAFKRANRFADRGKAAEKAVQEYLERWEKAAAGREFNRLVDSKAAGRIIKAAAADFEWFCSNCCEDLHGLIEVKETQHEYRLSRDKLPQLPRLRKRANAGGTCFVLVNHSTLGKWRLAPVKYLTSTGDKGSWNLSDLLAFDTAKDAMVHAYPEVFE